jgi:hypothetical protein
MKSSKIKEKRNEQQVSRKEKETKKRMWGRGRKTASGNNSLITKWKYVNNIR